MGTNAAVEVGATVRAELARRHHSQQWLAEKLGVAQAGVSRRLLGKIPFDVAELQIVAHALDVDIRDLMPKTAAVAA